MQNYHKHTSQSNVFTPDSAASYDDYVNRALELGHNVISSVEHGFQGNYYIPYELVNKHNDKLKEKLKNNEITEDEFNKRKLKFIFGTEAYWVKNRLKDYNDGDADKTNCHIVILAKNEEGRRDINEALSIANIDGYYIKPRVDLELLMKIKPENVLVTTACLKYWAYDDIDEITEKLHEHFKNNFYLEIQYHNTDLQKRINQHILELSNKLGIKIIFGYDSHYIYPNQFQERNNYLEARGIKYDADEIGWYMDYPDEQEVRRRLSEQGVLNHREIDECIKNTDLLLEFDDIILDKEIKLPKNYFFNGEWVGDKTQEWRDKQLRKIIYTKWEEEKKNICSSRYAEYEHGIKYELDAIIGTKMSDYFLIDYAIVKDGIENGGIITKTGRGSAVSYYVNYLLGFSNIDRFVSPVVLYPDRFISKTRILQSKSLPDIDLNLGTPEVFVESQLKVMGEGHAYPMISYKPLQKSSAFKLYAKSQKLEFELANMVTKQIQDYEKTLKQASEDEKELIDIFDFVDKEYHKYLNESIKYQGIINAKSQAPCGYLIYDGDIKREIGLIKCKSDSTGKEVITTVIDGMVAENYKFVKNDLLKVDVWLTINKIFEAAGVNTPSVTEIMELVRDDKKTWEVYERGLTLGVNQMESQFGSQSCRRYKPKSIQELTSLVAALRPGFKTQLNNFLERKPYTTGVEKLDELLKDSFHYMMYQESIMTYLGWLYINQTETYGIIKKISKKKFKDKELKELKEKLLNGWIKNVGGEEGFNKTWEIIEAASKYSFNASHALSYAYDSVYGAYAKAHYPYEFYSVMMQHYSDKQDKDKVTAYKREMMEYVGIKEGKYKFGLDNRKFVLDKVNKVIIPSLKSIKGFSDAIAEILYKLGGEEYYDFLELFVTMRNNGISVARINDLIKISYFEDFGDIDYLLNFLKLLEIFYGNHSFKTQFKKEKIFELNLDYDIFRNNCKSEAPKMFMGIDSVAIVRELAKKFDSKTPFKKKISYHMEVLGYIDIVDKKYAGYCVAVDLDVKYSPKVTLYALANGNTIPVKVNKKIFQKNPIKRGDIIKVLAQCKKNKMKKADDGWAETDEKEWWITEYQKF